MTSGSNPRRRKPKGDSKASASGKKSDASSPARRPGNEETSRLFVVDRREGPIAVLVADDDTTIDVKAAQLPASCRTEGAVVRVPLDAQGQPDWADATRDRAEEARRLAELQARTARLRRSDPGGDVVL